MSRKMLKRWLTRRPRVTVDTARVPNGLRVYAIGDICGRADLLRLLHDRIAADAANADPATCKLAIYLGNYVDRGLHSREVIDVLLEEPLSAFENIHLRGNHDHEFLGFLEDPMEHAEWLRYGGDATLYSYGVRLPADTPVDRRLALLGERLREAVPADHVEFLMGLPYIYEVGDYLFVHAGIDPDKSIEEQTPEDVLWIRDTFLEADCDFGKIVVHGHSVTEVPEVRENRIGIDTGACYTNTLTCLVLQGNNFGFLSTRNPQEPTTLTLTIDQDYDTYTVGKANRLLDTLSTVLDIPQRPRIINVKRGSVQITMELPFELVQRLVELQQRGMLSQLDITEVRPMIDAAAAAIVTKTEYSRFDVFMCHNADDKPEVKRVATNLRSRGILPWLDEWAMRPGMPWQKELEHQIDNIKSAAVFIGESGIGPWQSVEVEAFIRHFVKRKCPVIPTILRSCKTQPHIPLFLDGMTCVDFHRRKPDPYDHLIWGITGEKSFAD